MTVTRRAALARLGAGLGLAVSYGLLGAYAVAYLFPPAVRRRARRLFIGRQTDMPVGTARPFVDEKGCTLLLQVRADGLVAFDLRCPHLGCKVHWEPALMRFVCPCHQGVFDHDGKAIAGPPAAAGQSLARIPLQVDLVSGTVFLPLEG